VPSLVVIVPINLPLVVHGLRGLGGRCGSLPEHPPSDRHAAGTTLAA
jgi:hypothetical protein